MPQNYYIFHIFRNNTFYVVILYTQRLLTRIISSDDLKTLMNVQVRMSIQISICYRVTENIVKT
jgi:hypothetical protein